MSTVLVWCVNNRSCRFAEFQNDTLYAYHLPAQVFTEHKEFLKFVRQRLMECHQQDCLHDTSFQNRPTAHYRAFSWQHLIGPLASLVREGLARSVATRYNPEIQDLEHAVQITATHRASQDPVEGDDIGR